MVPDLCSHRGEHQNNPADVRREVRVSSEAAMSRSTEWLVKGVMVALGGWAIHHNLVLWNRELVPPISPAEMEIATHYSPKYHREIFWRVYRVVGHLPGWERNLVLRNGFSVKVTLPLVMTGYRWRHWLGYEEKNWYYNPFGCWVWRDSSMKDVCLSGEKALQIYRR